MNPFRSKLVALALMAFLGIAAVVPASAEAPSAPNPQPLPGEGIAGDWLGALKVGAASLRLGLHVEKKEDGSLTAVLDSIDQGAKIPVGEIAFENRTVKLSIAAIGAGYQGKLNADGSALDGEWTQGPQKLPLSFERRAAAFALNRPQLPKAPFPYDAREVTFESAAGNVRLAGTLVVPEGTGPFPAVALVSGSGPQDRDESLLSHKPFLVIADALARRGVASLRWDDRGVGASGGDHFGSTVEDFAADARAAVAFLRSRPEVAGKAIGIVGHSEGGLIGPRVAAAEPALSFLVLLAPPGEPLRSLLARQTRSLYRLQGLDEKLIERVLAMQSEDLERVADSSIPSVKLQEKLRVLTEERRKQFTDEERAKLGFDAATIEREIQVSTTPWFRSLMAEDPATHLRKVKIPVLALFGEKDFQVDAPVNADAVRSALAAAKNPDFEVRTFPGLNHLFQHARTGGMEEYGTIEETFAPEALTAIGDWIAARFPERKGGAESPPAADGAKPASSPTLRIVNARLIDGTGAPGRPGSLRIVGDRIAAIGDLAPLPGEEVLDAQGRVLAPGFIDTHSHATGDLFEIPEALGAVSQGITTVVGGQDGDSFLPLAEYFARLEKAPAAINVASYVGHGTLREKALGEDFRRVATTAEIAEMSRLLELEMKAGALGLSSGLEYDPGIYSSRGELIDLARVAARYGGRYISHIRSEDRKFWDAIDEILAIGREAKLPVQISHVKLAMRNLWGQAPRLLALLDQARAEGVDVTADIYPYLFWHSSLTVLFPDRDFENLEVAKQVLAEIAPADGLLLGRYLPNPAYAGRTVAEIAKERGEAPEVTLVALIRDAEALRRQGKDGGESVIATSMIEGDLDRLLAWPHTSLCTDGQLDGAHPRGFGSYPRVLGRYVRERGVLGLEEAVRKMTSLAADHLGIQDRGRLVVGAFADLVLFDPTQVIDRATTKEPQALSSGIERVWVNGRVVFSSGSASGARPGRVLRRTESPLPPGGSR